MLNEIADKVHKIAIEKGFWCNGNITFGDTIALIHSEASEALEEFRKNKFGVDVMYYEGVKHPDGKNLLMKPEGVPSEFADIIIRVLDACAYYGIDIDRAVAEKIEYNKTRDHLHGGKAI